MTWVLATCRGELDELQCAVSVDRPSGYGVLCRGTLEVTVETVGDVEEFVIGLFRMLVSSLGRRERIGDILRLQSRLQRGRVPWAWY